MVIIAEDQRKRESVASGIGCVGRWRHDTSTEGGGLIRLPTSLLPRGSGRYHLNSTFDELANQKKKKHKSTSNFKIKI